MMKHNSLLALILAGVITLSQAPVYSAEKWVDAEEEIVGIGADFEEVPEEEFSEDDQIVFDDQWDEPGVDDVLMDASADDSVADEKTTEMWETEQDAGSVNDAQNLGFQEMDEFEAETLYNYEETLEIFGSSEEEKSGTCGNNGLVTWRYDGAGTLTIGGQGAMDDEDQIDIWSVVGGPDKSDVKKIVIGDEITSIGKGCFRQAGVETVVLGNNISVIGEEAFEDCYSLGEIRFPDSLSVIRSYAFQDCDSLEEVVFPDHVNEIQNYAFNDCTELQKITFGSGITTIGQNAFASSAIYNLNIPSTLTYLGENAFSFCNNLNTITLPAAFDQTETGREPFFSCRNVEVRIEEGVKELPDYLFNGSFVKKMYLPSTIEKLGECSLTCFSAFPDEDDLENVQASIIYRGTKEEFLQINRIDNSLDDFAFEGESVHYHCVVGDSFLDEDGNSVYTYKYEDPIPNEEGELYTIVILNPVVPRSKPVLNMTHGEDGLAFSWTVDEEPVEYKLEYKNDAVDVWNTGYMKTFEETSVSCVYGDAFKNSDF